MLVTSISCSGDPGTDTLPPHSQMLSRMVSPGSSWRSPASSWERAAQCPEVSVPAPLTLPWHLTVHTHILALVGSGIPPFSCHTWAQQKGLTLLRAAPPPRGQSWVHSKLKRCLPEQSSHPSAGTARALALPFPPADVPAAARRHHHVPSTEAKGFQHRHIHTPLAQVGT